MITNFYSWKLRNCLHIAEDIYLRFHECKRRSFLQLPQGKLNIITELKRAFFFVELTKTLDDSNLQNYQLLYFNYLCELYTFITKTVFNIYIYIDQPDAQILVISLYFH